VSVARDRARGLTPAPASCRLSRVNRKHSIGLEHRAGAPAGAALTRLTLTDFRNYEHLALRVAPGPVVLTGENGAGKTNLLESISFFAPGRGLRRAALADCARHAGAGGWAAACEIATPSGTVRLGTGLIGNAAEEERQRKCRIDGRTVSGPGAFGEFVRIVWLTPAMDRLFTGPSGDRRRFLDRLVSLIEPAHSRGAGRYDRAMSERNRLLSEASGEDRWLDALEAEMAETGVAMAAGRLAALDRLQAVIDAGAPSSDFPPARLSLVGEVEDALAAMPALDAEDRLRADLRNARARDRAAGRTLDGPHRSDLVARHGATGADAAHCSSGEQKALLISVVLAQARLVAELGGAPPLILLDEVTAHLDRRRRESLFADVLGIGAQAWMTGTDRELFAALGPNGQFFTVADGRVTPSPAIGG